MSYQMGFKKQVVKGKWVGIAKETGTLLFEAMKAVVVPMPPTKAMGVDEEGREEAATKSPTKPSR